MDVNSKVSSSGDLGKVEEVLRTLLVDSYFSDFRYSAGFGLEFSREDPSFRSSVPQSVRLAVRSEWRVGDQEEWGEILEGFSKKLPQFDSCDPKRAYLLMAICGDRVVDLDVSDQGHLSIHLENGAKLEIPGKEDEFDESWIVDVALDVPQGELWSVVCSSDGEVFCRYPIDL